MTDADIAVIEHRLSEIDEKLDRIEAHVSRTNGRVTAMELWKERLSGAWFAVALAGPAISGIVVGLILTHL